MLVPLDKETGKKKAKDDLTTAEKADTAGRIEKEKRDKAARKAK